MNWVFVDDDALVGTVNGINQTFVIGHTPNPEVSLRIYRNGIRLRRIIDFTVNGATVTFVSGQIPTAGDVLIAEYRYIP